MKLPEGILNDYKKAASLGDIPEADNVIVVRKPDIERYSIGKNAAVVEDYLDPDVFWGFTLKESGEWKANYDKPVPHITKKEIDEGNVYVSKEKAKRFSLEEWEHPEGRRRKK